jgi:hypothetical protein
MLDANEGPFTFKELRSIDVALDAQADLIEEKAIYFLCRDWGVRPIQVALLRTTDIGKDELGPYVMVPSVKGIRRSRLRRDPSNFKKRSVTDETYDALLKAAEKAPSAAKALREQLVGWSVCSEDVASAFPIPLFPAPRTKRRSRVMAADRAIAEYILHSDAGHISRRIRRLTQILSLRRFDGLEGSQGDQLEIGMLRLRRTKGTSMVLNGATPFEVAEALDHQTTQTIAHYFKLNLDLIELIDVLQSKNPDIKAAADAWAGRLVAQSKKVHLPKIKIGKLGICSLGKQCPHHPTVTCYACKLFEPYLDGDHSLARKEIIEFKAFVSETSTGPVVKQIDAAIAGVDAVIQAIKSSRHE